MRCPLWLKKNGFNADDVAKLHGTSADTLSVWKREFWELSVDHHGFQPTKLQIPQGVFLQHTYSETKDSQVQRTSHGKTLKEHIHSVVEK